MSPEQLSLQAEQLSAEQMSAEQMSAEQLSRFAEQLTAEQLSAEQLSAEHLSAEQLFGGATVGGATVGGATVGGAFDVGANVAEQMSRSNCRVLRSKCRRSNRRRSMCRVTAIQVSTRPPHSVLFRVRICVFQPTPPPPLFSKSPVCKVNTARPFSFVYEPFSATPPPPFSAKVRCVKSIRLDLFLLLRKGHFGNTHAVILKPEWGGGGRGYLSIVLLGGVTQKNPLKDPLKNPFKGEFSCFR